MNNQSPEMPFWDHLEELRWRLIKSIIAILIGAGFSYAYSDIIMYWLINPTESLSIDLNLQVLKITSMFTVKLSVALFGGMILGLPVILYQFWRFISPAFEDKYGVAVIFTVLFSSAFFLLGMSFAYFVIIPFSLAFFTSLTAETIDVAYNFTLEGYLMYILWLIFGCGLLFQLPVISIFFTKIGILTPAFLREYRKFAVVVFLILGAVLTPPDPVSQILIVVPLIILYEFSILISKLFKPKDSLV
ncbi:MAG TPA: twin-arginine translocase subunit TatC [Candidatus Marinimicrobia bacterium]|jgi:sec-independent protein translocase protein TatC|nr:twin-arginine translocase subunit TatC [Candidatus Neomarinimicrobiota bacterium]|tara:strand:- start:725 stop:1462 length:738 start_codon:yes stop_codon:yes gene_type:complete